MVRLAFVAAVCAACGGDGLSAADASPCNPVTTPVGPTQSPHVPSTETPAYQTNPPANGPHYFMWARWSRIYADPIPRGYYVHNQEHGGVTIQYNCPTGCPQLEADLASLVAGLPVEAGCTAPRTGRWLVTPDPLLPPDVPIAASAWGEIYTADCFDFHTLRRFYQENVGQAPEDTCAEGSYPPPSTIDGGVADAGP